ncbi:MAG: methyltransferase domain-containing protein [Chloroflexi bacterium]|nr:methyltransferase domain-containing protein [Chloroflexota bacterium]
MIDPELLELLADPLTHHPLQLQGRQLINQTANRVFPIRKGGVPSFVTASAVPLRHHLWRAFYDRTAFAYDVVLDLGHRLHLGAEPGIRSYLFSDLDVPAATTILDIGAGTAANRTHLPAGATYVGLDPSLGMLQRARKRLTRANLHGHLVHADALSLPFKPDRFNLIVCMGVLQHLSHPFRAVSEMRRVAQQACIILLLDEISSLPATLKHLKKKFPGSSAAMPKLNALSEILFPETLPYSVKTSLLGDYYLLEATQTNL